MLISQPQIMAAAITKEDLVSAINFVRQMGLNGVMNIVKTFGVFNSNDRQAMQTVVELISPIAFALMLIYFAMGIVEDAQQRGGEVDIKVFAKAGISLIVGTIFIQISPYIIGQFGNLNNMLISGVVSQYGEELTVETQDAVENMDSYHLIALFALLIISILQAIPAILCLVIVAVTIFSTKLEMTIRLAFTPVGMAGFASDSGRHGAIRYFRKLAASMMYMAGIIVVFYLANEINQASEFTELVNAYDSADASNLFINGMIALEKNLLQLAIPFAAIGAISAIKGVINEAVGA